MSPEEWAVKKEIEAQSDELEKNLERWTKYDMLHMRNDLDDLFKFLLMDAHLDSRGRAVVDMARLSFEKIFYGTKNENKRTN